jgi:addiction module HigA family antidote
LLVFGGQLLPRAVGRRWAPQLVPVLVPLLRLVDLLLTPFHVVADLVRRLLASRPASAIDDDAREGLEELMRDGAFDDISSTEEMAIISGVVQFGEKVVQDVMTPRATIFALPDGLPAAELARQIAVPINRITGIINGQRGVTADTALRLAHWFGTSPQFWMNLQQMYELRVAERDVGAQIATLPRRAGR